MKAAWAASGVATVVDPTSRPMMRPPGYRSVAQKAAGWTCGFDRRARLDLRLIWINRGASTPGLTDPPQPPPEPQPQPPETAPVLTR